MAAVRYLGYLKVKIFYFRCGSEDQRACVITPNFVLIGGFSKVQTFSGRSCSESQYESQIPNFVPIGQTVADIWPFFDFSRWRPSAILDLDRPQRVVGLYRLAKFGCNRHCSFEDMHFQYFAHYGRVLR